MVIDAAVALFQICNYLQMDDFEDRTRYSYFDLDDLSRIDEICCLIIGYAELEQV